ncbi:ABC transporter ATP-binding protein [Salidesulfovibrio onnuriiensis]|uniref:ABC transporter ATP-binding protein n=1 Tax=Salidesulfovibrio onnuriiensis TaxID=2583823 RepID=UPI0011CC03C5|nr:ATP-binding cassette domain-containing protein [Salidesulfovibrio onnuriiensis]
MLEAKNIDFRYDSGPQVLRGLNMAIRPGEVVGLPGPSGQGKSTLGRILAGYLAPQSGEVALHGEPLPTARYCPVQMLFQHPELAMNPRWKIREILCEAYTPDRELLGALSVNPSWLDRFPHELSGGELQRIAVARAMGPGTEFIVADEMTAMLDPNTQALIWHGVLDMAARRNMGILAISHDRHLLQRICTRIDESFSSGHQAAA